MNFGINSQKSKFSNLANNASGKRVWVSCSSRKMKNDPVWSTKATDGGRRGRTTVDENVAYPRGRSKTKHSSGRKPARQWLICFGKRYVCQSNIDDLRGVAWDWSEAATDGASGITITCWQWRWARGKTVARKKRNLIEFQTPSVRCSTWCNSGRIKFAYNSEMSLTALQVQNSEDLHHPPGHPPI